MKKTTMHLLVISIIILFISGCNLVETENLKQKKDNQKKATTKVINNRNDDAIIIIAEENLISHSDKKFNELYSDNTNRWETLSHINYSYICAKKLGLSEERAKIMRNATEMPDIYQSGIQNGFNQQWSHVYIYNSKIKHIWGDADDDFHDNIAGDSGEDESPEGYNGKWAGYYYKRGDRSLGDWYLGYACHFIQDVNLVLHSTFPDIMMAAHHTSYETWVANNWDKGHNFAQYAKTVSVIEYYTITNLKQAIHKAARNSNYYYNENCKKAWLAYKASNYPTSTGSGSKELITRTSKMVIEATKWTGAAIIYTLDKYNQW